MLSLDMHITRKHLIIALTALVLAISATLLFILFRQKTFTVAYRNTPESVQTSITKAIEDYFLQAAVSKGKTKSKTKVNTVVYSIDLPIEQQITKKAKPNLLICSSGLAAEKATTIAQSMQPALSTQMLKDIPMAIRNTAITKDNFVYAVPLLLDHYELLQHIDSKKQPVFLFAGGQDSALLAFAGAVTESVYGSKAAKQLALDCRNNKPEDIPMLQQTAKVIGSAIASGAIDRSSLQMSQSELNTLWSINPPSTGFMMLSHHRTMPRSLINHYNSTYFPSLNNKERNLCAPVITAIPFAKNKKAAITQELVVQHLLSRKTQETLSKSTGLAPVESSAQAADLQADDLRYWVAASGVPIAPLGEAATETSAELAELAASFREMVFSQIFQNQN